MKEMVGRRSWPLTICHRRTTTNVVFILHILFCIKINALFLRSRKKQLETILEFFHWSLYKKLSTNSIRQRFYKKDKIFYFWIIRVKKSFPVFSKFGWTCVKIVQKCALYYQHLLIRIKAYLSWNICAWKNIYLSFRFGRTITYSNLKIFPSTWLPCRRECNTS